MYNFVSTHNHISNVNTQLNSVKRNNFNIDVPASLLNRNYM